MNALQPGDLLIACADTELLTDQDSGNRLISIAAEEKLIFLRHEHSDRRERGWPSHWTVLLNGRGQECYTGLESHNLMHNFNVYRG